MIKNIQKPQIYSFKDLSTLELPLYESRVSAGFPSPADDELDETLDLNKYLVKHPEATFFVRVDGDSMVQVGMYSGDILIVDRAQPVRNNDIIVAIVEGEFTVKRFVRTEQGSIELHPENPAYEPILLTEEMEFMVWGVVSFVIHAV
jgi:DNA polymerase V